MQAAPAVEMPPVQAKPLTIIVAATRSMGIGKYGGLPWPMLKQEMGYFARVTKRIPTSSTKIMQNAVIMGRKTWDSVPPKFRPLKDRLNIVITRQQEALPAIPGSVVVAKSLSEAISEADRDERVARTFVIGGASIYKEALEGSAKERVNSVLLTSIHTEFECDTFFPADLEGEADWLRKSSQDLVDMTGEELKNVEGIRSENGVEYEFRLYERIA